MISLGAAANRPTLHSWLELRSFNANFFYIASTTLAVGQLVLAYDKMHLCDMGDCSEIAHGCSPGEGELGVFECDGVRVGVTICYDLRFPELYRALAWDAGCDLILHPAALVRDATFPMYHQVGRRREEASVAGSTPLAALKASTLNQRLSQPTPSPSRPSSLLRLAPSRMVSTCSLSATRASASARRPTP